MVENFSSGVEVITVNVSNNFKRKYIPDKNSELNLVQYKLYING